MVITEEEIEFMLYIIAPKANEDILLDRIDYQLRLLRLKIRERKVEDMEDILSNILANMQRLIDLREGKRVTL